VPTALENGRRSPRKLLRAVGGSAAQAEGLGPNVRGATRIPGRRSPSAHGSYHLRCRRRPISCAVVTAMLETVLEDEPEWRETPYIECVEFVTGGRN
jgi:hypothetical protein